jgi:hypothetical protein
MVPAPTSYQVRKDLIITQNKWHSKSPRITFPEEVMKIEKKKNVPDPTAYKPKFRLTEPKITGCFSFKAEREGQLDEAMKIGSEMVAPKDRNFS